LRHVARGTLRVYVSLAANEIIRIGIARRGELVRERLQFRNSVAFSLSLSLSLYLARTIKNARSALRGRLLLSSFHLFFFRLQRALVRSLLNLITRRAHRASERKSDRIVSVQQLLSFFLLPFLLIRGRISFSSARLLHGEGEGRNEKRNMGRLRATCNRVTANPR